MTNIQIAALNQFFGNWNLVIGDYLDIGIW